MCSGTVRVKKNILAAAAIVVANGTAAVVNKWNWSTCKLAVITNISC